MPPRASLFVSLGIPGLSLCVLLAIVFAIRARPHGDARAARRFVLFAGLWLSLTGALAALGVFARFDATPPPLLGVVLPVLLLPVWFASSRTGRELARDLPLSWLVGFQVFRLPLELVMHQAALEGVMPAQMTYTGLNFDIVTGASALVVGGLAAYGRAPRFLLHAFNILGSGLLFVVVAIALASLPLVHAFGQAPAQLNTWVAYFPFIWLPSALVASALLGHLLLWQRLLGGASQRVDASMHAQALTPAAPSASARDVRGQGYAGL